MLRFLNQWWRLARLLAFASFGDRVAVLPGKLEVPLFVLQYLHRQGISLPEGHVLVGGLDESLPAILDDLIKVEASAARELQAFAFDRGDGETSFWQVQHFGSRLMMM